MAFPSSTIEDPQDEDASLDDVTLPAPECFYPQFQVSKVEGRQAKANNYDVRHSVYKLVVFARAIQGKHLYDA